MRITVTIGLIITVCIGLFCEPFLRKAVTVPRPKIFPEQNKFWPQIPGLLECVIFFAAFWSTQHLIAAAWLMFKVGAKWAAWQHLIKALDKIEGDPLTGLKTKNELGSFLLNRFLSGTLYNIVSGLTGVAVAPIIAGSF